MPVPLPLIATFKTAGTYKNGSVLTLPTLRMRGMRYYYGIHTSIRICIYLLVMCSISRNGERAGLANLKLTIDFVGMLLVSQKLS